MDSQPDSPGPEQSPPGKKPRAEESKSKVKKKNRWPQTVFVITLVLSSVISLVADVFISPAGLLVALLVLTVLMLMGIIADIVGVAITSCQNAPLAAMAARKVRGAKEALWLSKNADRMSNILNDVVGDVCSIISGTASTAVSLRLLMFLGNGDRVSLVLGVVVSGLVAAITVGGKALGKSFAINQAKTVVMTAGKVMAFFTGIPALLRGKKGGRNKPSRQKK